MLRIAVVATYDVTDINKWSGIPFYIFEILKKHYEVTPIKVVLLRPLISWIRGLYFNRIRQKRYFITFDTDVYRKSKSQLDLQFEDGYDVLITFDYFLIPALAKHAKHVILLTDATFGNLLNYYDYRTDLCRLNVKGGHSLQKQAFEKLSLAFYSSEWALTSAAEYGARPEQLRKLLFGSNLSKYLDRNEIDQVIDDRLKTKEILIFFPVVYWERKGGEYVLELIRKLNQNGQNAKLIVAGKIPDGIEGEEIINLGYLDKKNPDQEKIMMDYYRQSHFLIMPSKADCTPIVFAEANSFALPVITTKTGGIETMINPKNDNGVAFHLDENYVDKAASFIVSTLADETRYRKICQNAYQVFLEQFDWSVGEKVLVEGIDTLMKES